MSMICVTLKDDLAENGNTTFTISTTFSTVVAISTMCSTVVTISTMFRTKDAAMENLIEEKELQHGQFIVQEDGRRSI
jgi:hypothetical protein